MAQKPSIPKGTRDFGPVQLMRRNFIFESIKSVFKNHGYQGIETPAMETLTTLMGKYGEEGDKLIFKILNSGDFAAKIGMDDFVSLLDKENPTLRVSKKMTPQISEKALRYDLTVPFARYIVQHRHETVFPFKRYQIQPVWRADRPQKGRYREFYQCDADVIGSTSLLNEVELIQIIKEVFNSINIRFVIKLNNRKILAGIAETIGQADKIIDITVAIDKLDKIGLEKVNQELINRGLPTDAVSKLQPILHLTGDNLSKLDQLSDVLKDSVTGMKGIAEIRTVLSHCSDLDLEDLVELDLTLARGLNYYTGAIIEVKALDVAMGSICGGGRYDDLTGIFGLPDVSGVGISFGADRIYDILESLDAFPDDALLSTMVLFVNFGDKEITSCLPIASSLRRAGISTEVYPDSAKIKKQMSYANSNSIPFVILAGENELSAGSLTIKNMKEGTQESVPIQQITKYILEQSQ
ncbi:MAG: histidine--tRNA ligase [Bacteroidales bacterium]|nr:histidine--tRNA ligase [Bacteroidales bacterium]